MIFKERAEKQVERDQRRESRAAEEKAERLRGSADLAESLWRWTGAHFFLALRDKHEFCLRGQALIIDI